MVNQLKADSSTNQFFVKYLKCRGDINDDDEEDDGEIPKRARRRL